MPKKFTTRQIVVVVVVAAAAAAAAVVSLVPLTNFTDPLRSH